MRIFEVFPFYEIKGIIIEASRWTGLQTGLFLLVDFASVSLLTRNKKGFSAYFNHFPCFE